jgi:hypothetical protein
MKNQIVITGCPRSGTKFISLLLRAHGLDVPHEYWGSDGIVAGMLAGDPTLKHFVSRITVIHQVRHPLKTIASLTTIQEVGWQFMSRRLGNLALPEDKVHRGMMIWHDWNRLSEQHAARTYRVEGIEGRLSEICALAGLTPMKRHPGVTVSTNANARPHPELTWDQCDRMNQPLTRAIRQLASHYGYKL